MKKTRPRILVVIVLLAIVGALVWFFRHEPVARLVMPDGTELRLEYVTYGTEHRMPGVGSTKAWFSRFAQRWPRLGMPVYEAEYTYAFEKPELVLWFTHFDHKTRSFLPAPIWVNAEAAEGESIFVGADESAIPADSPHDTSPRPPGVVGSWRRDTQKDAPPTPNIALVSLAYERRNPKLRLRFGDADMKGIVTISNPAAKTTFPVWHPEPLPQSSRIGEVGVVLHSVKADQDLRTVNLEFEVLDHGREVGIDWEDGWEILDATGNRGISFNPPPFSEPAWKIRKSFARTGDFAFAMTEGQLLGPGRMPDAGKCEILPLHERDVKWGLRFAVLLGPGYYRWEEGTLVESRAPQPETEWWEHAEPIKEHTFVVYSQTPSVFLAYSPDGEGFELQKKWDVGGFDYGKVVRVRSGEEGYGLRTKTTSRMGFGIGDKSLRGVIYPMTRSDRPELSDTNPAKSLPAGSEVWIQVVPVEMESLEFLIAPPQPAKPDQPL
jgi:hypothetical protein